MSTTALTPAPEPVQIKPYRALDTFTADAVLREVHEDDSQITQHPVEYGSTISDGKYALPARVTLEYAWSLSVEGRSSTSLQDLYGLLRQLKDTLPTVLFDIYTGKRHYTNMTIKSLTHTTDQSHENILAIQITCQEVLTATTSTIPFVGVTAADIAATIAQQAATGAAAKPAPQAASAAGTEERGSVQTKPSTAAVPTLTELQAAD